MVLLLFISFGKSVSECPAHGARFFGGLRPRRFARRGYAAAEDASREAGLFKAVHPALHGGLRIFRRFFRIFHRGGEEIDFAEGIVRREERVQPVEEGLQLAGNAVVIDRRGEDDRRR